jgi:hemerythrin-like domain-containing protein
MESSDIVELLEFNHEEALKKTQSIVGDLQSMRYEGKASFQKNLKRMKAVLSFFSEEMMDHVALEEETIFPYLETHLPRFTPAIKFLLAEHEEFSSQVKIFKFLVRELASKKSEQVRMVTVERLKETGTYLAYLLRHHIEAEQRGIYDTIDKELHHSEKKELKARLVKALS